ncbi:MAG TPA: hypothetical protein VK497_03745 [Candidatus Saccharimonadales bacterium]|nr:hypothetical protein [Candidatus Saccharimonadales bacterium]
MSLIYITGISGSGKSAVRSELLKRGYEAHSTDEDEIAGFYNNETGQAVKNPDDPNDRTPEWRAHHTWNLSREAVETLAEKTMQKPIFLCGVASNDVGIGDLFSQVFALNISAKTLKHRIDTRTGNSFGKLPHEFESLLGWQKTAEEDYRKAGAIIIDGERSVELVVDEILSKVS